MWRCDNVRGLSEHVICHVVFSWGTFLFVGSRPLATGRPILRFYMSYDVFPRKDAFWGLVRTPHLGVEIPQSPILWT